MVENSPIIHLMKDLLKKDHFVKGFLYIRPDYQIQCQKSTIEGKAWLPFPKIWDFVYTKLNIT